MTKQSESTCDIDKPINQETKKTLNHETINDAFEKFWILYDKKVGKKTCQDLWGKLNDVDRGAVMGYLPGYVTSKEKQYRKDPERFLKKRAWEDELIYPEQRKMIAPDLSEVDHNVKLNDFS